jgi:transcription elongation factor GreB
MFFFPGGAPCTTISPEGPVMQATTIIDDEDDGPPRLSGGRFYMTPMGHATLTAELHHLRAIERPSIVDIVSWAAGNGDRSENGDYQYGKRRLREIDRRMRFLIHRLRHAEVIDPRQQTNRTQVFFGASVTYVNERDEELKVTIVGVDEADMALGKISIASPVALALLRAQVGNEVVVRTPRGTDVVEILAIDYPA